MTTSLTDRQLRELETTERIASCFSLAATSFVFFTFVYSPAFRKPVNRLLFFATWGNMACNVATLLSQTGIRAGADSHLCQFQGFLLQMFLPADALWNLAMAINVYMTLFRKYNAQQLKSLEWKYHLLCYGCPFVMAFVLLFIRTEARGPIYGPATLWCWIDIDWAALRVAVLYAPAWCCILLSFGIYAISGREIFTKRQQLRAFNHALTNVVPAKNLSTDFKTTEIRVKRELATLKPPDKATVFLSPDERTGRRGTNLPSGGHYDPYTVSIGSTTMGPRVAPTSTTYPTEEATNPSSDSRMELRSLTRSSIHQRKHGAALEANAAAWAYTKVALLFFVSLLITWLPSSVNRVYSLRYPELISLSSTYASSIVLPLMGFWNSVIYITTSWRAVRLLFTGQLPSNRSRVKLPSLIRRRTNPSSQKTRVSDSESMTDLAVAGGSNYSQV